MENDFRGNENGGHSGVQANRWREVGIRRSRSCCRERAKGGADDAGDSETRDKRFSRTAINPRENTGVHPQDSGDNLKIH